MPVVICTGHCIRIRKNETELILKSGTVIDEKDFYDFGTPGNSKSKKKVTGEQQIQKWIDRGTVREIGQEEVIRYKNPPIKVEQKIEMGDTFDFDPKKLEALDLIQLKVMLQGRNIDPNMVPTKEGAILILSKDFKKE